MDEEKAGELEAMLNSDVDFAWAPRAVASAEVYTAPMRWQTNTTGESLLSVHRKKERDG